MKGPRPAAVALGSLVAAGLALSVLGVRMWRLEVAEAERAARERAREVLAAAVVVAPEVAARLVGEPSDRWELELPPAVGPTAEPLAAALLQDRLLLDEAAYLERSRDDADGALAILKRLAARAPDSALAPVAAVRAAALAARRGDSALALELLAVAAAAPSTLPDPASGIPVRLAALYLAIPLEASGTEWRSARALLDATRDGALLRADGGPDGSDLVAAAAEAVVHNQAETVPKDLLPRFSKAASRSRLGHAILARMPRDGIGGVDGRIVRRQADVLEVHRSELFATALAAAVRAGETRLSVSSASAPPPPDALSIGLPVPLEGLVLHAVRGPPGAAAGGALLALLAGLGVYLLGTLLAIAALRRSTRAAQMQADFVASVSHEMKTPIAAVQAMAEMLADGRVPDAGRARIYAERIRAEMQRLGATVRNVLDAARIERGVEALVRLRPGDPAAVVEGVAQAFRPALEGRGFRFDVSSEPAPGPVALDPGALTSVMSNLLDNAMKFSDGRKEVLVVAGPHDGAYRITVLDRGPGVPVRDRERVFDRFFRGEAAKDGAVPGVGLGLHVARELVGALGGTIRVEDREGGGAAFLVDLPLSAHPVLEASTEQAS